MNWGSPLEAHGVWGLYLELCAWILKKKKEEEESRFFFPGNSVALPEVARRGEGWEWGEKGGDDS